MGPIRGTFSLSNSTRPDLAPLEVSVLADSGAVHLCIPEHLAILLSLAERERREVVLADAGCAFWPNTVNPLRSLNASLQQQEPGFGMDSEGLNGLCVI